MVQLTNLRNVWDVGFFEEKLLWDVITLVIKASSADAAGGISMFTFYFLIFCDEFDIFA